LGSRPNGPFLFDAAAPCRARCSRVQAPGTGSPVPDTPPSPRARPVRACGRRRPDRSTSAVPRPDGGGVSSSRRRWGRRRRCTEQPCRRAGHQRRRRGQQAVRPPFSSSPTPASLPPLREGRFPLCACFVSFCFLRCNWLVRTRRAAG
jgi:hypothetical protein